MFTKHKQEVDGIISAIQEINHAQGNLTKLAGILTEKAESLQIQGINFCLKAISFMH